MKSKYPDPINALISKIPNKYLLTCVVFLRAKELNGGDSPLTEIDNRMLKEKDYIGMAEKEIFDGKIQYEYEEK